MLNQTKGKVLTEQERKKVLDDVIAEASKKQPGRPISDEFEQHEVCLPLCTLRIVESKHEGFAHLVYVVENFGPFGMGCDGSLVSSYDGIRKVYAGNTIGLEDVFLEYIRSPAGLASAKTHQILRSAVRGDFTEEDKEMFDAYLVYAQKDLTCPREILFNLL